MSVYYNHEKMKMNQTFAYSLVFTCLNRVILSLPMFISCFSCSVYFTFYNCTVQMGFLPWKNLGCFPWGKPAATESRYPTYCACWVFQCFHNPPNSGMDYRIFNMGSDVNACDCTWGCTDTVRESALKVDSGRKIPCRTEESNLRQQHNGPML